MRYDYIDPFVNTAVRVLRAAMGPETRRSGEVSMAPANQIRGEVTVAIGITGDSDGDMVLCMTDGTARAISARLLAAPVPSLTPAALDALGELGNMIAGNAVSVLNDLGFDFSIHPPEVRVLTRVASDLGNREGIRIPLLTACGEVNVNVFLGAE